MPQNAGYAYAAYAVATVIYGLYAFSLWSRTRRQVRRPGSAVQDPPAPVRGADGE